MLAEVLDGGEDVGAGRQQAAVAEGAEDAGVVGGGGAQLEEPALRGGDGLVEQAAQLIGVPVELGDGERALGRGSAGGAEPEGGARGVAGRTGVPGLRTVRAVAGGAGDGCGGRALAGQRGAGDGQAGAGWRQAQEFGEALLGGEGLGGAALRVVGVPGGLGGVRGAGGGEFGAG
ncbi:hypothetical protein ABZ318_34600 [Streptomyces sp. NPDC006197]|uniref:hypothetical protein n=1 Tax=Streptomyces sp. NPDC006197 TaxID=3156685 RepID=UPI0033AA2D76